MDEREMFEAWWHANETWPVKVENIAFLAWQAGRRTTLDREAIIEECAKVCEGDGEETPDAWEWHSKDYARAIRELKTDLDKSATVSPEQWQQLVETSQKVAESAQRRADRARNLAIEECAKKVEHVRSKYGFIPREPLTEAIESIRALLPFLTSDKGGA